VTRRTRGPCSTGRSTTPPVLSCHRLRPTGPCQRRRIRRSFSREFMVRLSGRRCGARRGGLGRAVRLLMRNRRATASSSTISGSAMAYTTFGACRRPVTTWARRRTASWWERCDGSRPTSGMSSLKVRPPSRRISRTRMRLQQGQRRLHGRQPGPARRRAQGRLGHPGWVMSDWCATPSWEFAVAGLDEECGVQLDVMLWGAEAFTEPLQQAYADGKFPRNGSDPRSREVSALLCTIGGRHSARRSGVARCRALAPGSTRHSSSMEAARSVIRPGAVSARRVTFRLRGSAAPFGVERLEHR
jgi:hypothetical protein